MYKHTKNILPIIVPYNYMYISYESYKNICPQAKSIISNYKLNSPKNNKKFITFIELLIVDKLFDQWHTDLEKDNEMKEKLPMKHNYRSTEKKNV